MDEQTLIESLKVDNVHCVIIMGTNFAYGYKTRYKSKETQIGVNFHISIFLGIIAI
jgi:FAD synthase